MKFRGVILALMAMALFISGQTTRGQAKSELVADTAICTESTARQVVDSFIEDFNQGNTAALDRIFAGPGGFVWYTTGPPGTRLNAEATNRGDLIAYFASRHRSNERLRLESFRFNGESGGGLGNFEFELTRSADGLSPTPFNGKGAIDCTNVGHPIVVWSMDREAFLRARLPLYISLAVFGLAVLAAGAAVFLRRRGVRARAKLVARSNQNSADSSR